MDVDVRSLLRRLDSVNWEGASREDLEAIALRIMEGYWNERYCPVKVGDKVVSRDHMSYSWGEVINVTPVRFDIKGDYRTPKIVIRWMVYQVPGWEPEQCNITRVVGWREFEISTLEKYDWPDSILLSASAAEQASG